MKTFAAGLAAHYQLQNTTLTTCLEVRRRDGVYVRATSLDVDLVVDGETYLSAQGLDISNLEISAGLSVDRLELTIFPDDDIPEVDLLAGLWNFATFRIFECNYEDPAGGINVLRRGWTGEITAARVGYTIELRSLKQALQQQLGAVTQKTCRYRLGSTAMPLGLCMVDLAPWTFTYLVTAVASRRELTCSAAVEADEFYKEGIAHADDGECAGYEQKVKAFAAGVFTLSLPMPFEVNVGDSFTFVAGCQHRWLEDCRDKFDNLLNFGGEKDVPGVDALTADPEVDS